MLLPELARTLCSPSAVAEAVERLDVGDTDRLAAVVLRGVLRCWGSRHLGFKRSLQHPGDVGVLAMGRLRMPKEVGRRFWRLIAEGATTEQAATGVGVSVSTGRLWFRDGGGMPPLTLAEPTARFLTLAEREAMDLCWAEGWSQADIARELRRDASTVSRELRRNQLLQYPRRHPPAARCW